MNLTFEEWAKVEPIADRSTREAAKVLQFAIDDIAEIAQLLKDPVAVHANLLRGTIAKPSLENIIHLYSELDGPKNKSLVEATATIRRFRRLRVVPVIPTEAMLDAALDAAGVRQVAREPQTENGIIVEDGMTEEQAAEFNEGFKEEYANLWAAMLKALPELVTDHSFMHKTEQQAE